MKPHRLLIVGGVAGGASAAARARRLSETAEIVVFERGPDVSFANCGLPYFVGGEIEERENLVVQTPASLHARFNLDVRPRHEVVSVHPDRQEIVVRQLATGDTFTERYDSLILATGAAPLRPPIPGIDRAGHFVVRNLGDADQIQTWLQDPKVRRAVVVGGGYIGLEMAEQLHRRGLAVTVVEAQAQIMAPLDPELAALLQAELKQQGVSLHLNNGVAAFEAPASESEARASMVVLKGGQRLPADLVILGLGVRPDVPLARAAGLRLGTTGGIAVDAHMRTSDPHIWAVGDAVEVQDPVTDQLALIPLAGPANRQGRLAADSIFGRVDSYRGTWGTAILRLFSLTAACTGANERALQRVGRAHQSVQIYSGSHAGYFPGAERMTLKIHFDPDTGRLLGAQGVGPAGVDKRIDVLATALQAGLTVDDLAELELAYAPSFSSAKDPVNLIGMAAQNLQEHRVAVVQWHELPARLAAGVGLLDVRSPEERARGAVPGSVHIPLPELREHFAQLDPSRDWVVYCASGQRSYYACQVLQQHGYRVANLSGAYLTWKTVTDAGLLPTVAAA
ncbi:MAG: FAD-dependent oxidoreductase [Verrucomicrobia bacterium]|nr:FAD-dependent oxidoreductase [Verrucomicrobiota bacterium]